MDGYLQKILDIILAGLCREVLIILVSTDFPF